MRTAPYIQNLWNGGGPFIGQAGKPHTRVTIQSPFDGPIIHPVSAGNYAQRGQPVRWYQSLANDQDEVEVPNVKAVSIDRSIDQDAGTVEIVIVNQQMDDNGVASTQGQLGQPGYFTANRAQSRDARARWGITSNEWQNAFVPNAVLRTYQGYGGQGKSIAQALEDGNLILTGVWFLDDVTADTHATLRIKGRDPAKLLIEQQLYLPLVPAGKYPLKYFRWAYINDVVRAGSRTGSVTIGTAAPGVRAFSYSDSASDRWYGFNADIHGHRALDATDGNTDTYWLSVGNSSGDAPWAYDWLEYNVGSEINSVYINPWAGNFTMFVSIMTDGVWQGSDVIPYDYAALAAGEPEAVDTGTNIPYVASYGVPWETPGEYVLPDLYHADKIRVTFHNGTYTEWGPWHYRSGVREFSVSVNAAGPSASTTQQVTYQPVFVAGDTAADGVGYVTSDHFGDIDAFGDARRLDKTGGNPNVVPGDNIICVRTVPDFSATPSVGGAYYLLSQQGRLYCYGGAADRGDPNRDGYQNGDGLHGNICDLAMTPSGNGYWVLSTSGQIFHYGDAANYTDLPYVSADGGLQYSAIESHPSIIGVWIVRSDGTVYVKGGLTSLGNWAASTPPLDNENFAVSIRRTHDGGGYWILSQAGQVQAFGNAGDHGGVAAPEASRDWHEKYWELWPAVDGGYDILRGDGFIQPIATSYDSFGSPIPGGVARLRTDGNYLDYSDIIKDLALWSGFLLYDPALPVTDEPSVFGNIESTGAYAPDPLPDDLFDKKPVIDAMHALKETVGYILYVDDQGGFRFESPNWWAPGNFDEVGTYMPVIPEIDERKQLTEYSSTLTDDPVRSMIIISSEDPDQHISSTITTRYVPSTASTLRGLLKPAMWVNGYFQSPAEQKLMAELIALHIHFQQRTGSINCVANPAIGVNDQVRIWERQTGESYVHYVRSVHTEHDLESGRYTMSLTTNWLGTDEEWVINNGDQSPSAHSFDLSPPAAAFISNTGSATGHRLRPRDPSEITVVVPGTDLGSGSGDRPSPFVEPPASPSTTVERLLYLKQSPHEGIPHGVPSYYDWYGGPTIHNPTPGQYGAAIVWGQVYLAVGKSLPANTRVHVRDMRLYGWNPTSHAWTVLQSTSNIEGALYVEDFAGNASIPDGHRDEPEGGISAVMAPGYNFHFYPKQFPRPALPSNITQFVSTIQARLIRNDGSGPDNTNSRQLVANAGVDLYPTTTSVGGDPPVAGAGEGRFAYLTSEWQIFSLTTLSDSDLTGYPPPLGG